MKKVSIPQREDWEGFLEQGRVGLGRDLQQGLSGPGDIPSKGSKEGEGTGKSYRNDLLPVIWSPSNPGPERLSLPPGNTAQEKKGHRTLAQVSGSTPKTFPSSSPFPCSPHPPGSPERSVGGRKRGPSRSAPSAWTAVLRSCWGLWGLRRI